MPARHYQRFTGIRPSGELVQRPSNPFKTLTTRTFPLVPQLCEIPTCIADSPPGLLLRDYPRCAVWFNENLYAPAKSA